MEHILYAEDFELKLNLKIFRNDLMYPCNTSMKVSVQSGDFCEALPWILILENLLNFLRIYVGCMKIYQGAPE